MLNLIRSCAVLVLLGACALPRGAPVESEILARNDDESPDFAIYAVTRANLSALSHWPATDNVRNFGWLSSQAGPRDITIQPFDTVSLVVWDSEENSLMASPGQKLVDVGNLRVTDNGQIFVPYLGYLDVAGLSPDRARRMIESEMLAIVPSAQVQLSVEPGSRGSVSLVSGVNQPGTVPLPDGRFSVLSLISQGGGPDESLRNPQVRLIRSGRTYGTSLQTIVENPSQDTVLKGGDKVALVDDERFFRALGATGKEEIVYFTEDRISTLDAMSLIGGLEANRANPQGVLVLREYPASAVRGDGSGPGNSWVVFTVDLTSGDGLFSAGRFPVYSGDTVLVTESPVNAARTVFGLLGTVVGITDQFAQ
ncbi:polysaccharide biosynthesis/export family protein [Tropicimonas marinistellae]|uniref:polysaccharide biosynthesis/export family protein n=1 Tax=Tropicimonas marinistellae TaxID=1739787 RepID=UPI00098EB521|nr:polysaccharide biosynthesis/export family protein [Tropicimonas marinistellae]